jgi:hypothetical protein
VHLNLFQIKSPLPSIFQLNPEETSSNFSILPPTTFADSTHNRCSIILLHPKAKTREIVKRHYQHKKGKAPSKNLEKRRQAIGKGNERIGGGRTRKFCVPFG